MEDDLFGPLLSAELCFLNTVEEVAECDSWTPVLKVVVVINTDTILPLSHVQRMELLAEREEKRVWKLGSKERSSLAQRPVQAEGDTGE